jgi:hypothetical protein
MAYRRVVITALTNDDDFVSQEMSELLERLQDQLDLPSAEINDSELLAELPAEFEEWEKLVA